MTTKQLKTIHDDVKKINNYKIIFRDHNHPYESLSIETQYFRNKKHQSSKYLIESNRRTPQNNNLNAFGVKHFEAAKQLKIQYKRESGHNYMVQKQRHQDDNQKPERRLSAQIKGDNSSAIEEINTQNSILKQKKKAQLFSFGTPSTKQTKKQSQQPIKTMTMQVEDASIDQETTQIKKFQTLYTTKKFVKNSSKAPLYIKEKTPKYMYLNKQEDTLISQEDMYQVNKPFYRKYKELESQIQDNFGVHPNFKEEYKKQLQLCIELNKQNQNINEQFSSNDTHQTQMIDMLDRLQRDKEKRQRNQDFKASQKELMLYCEFNEYLQRERKKINLLIPDDEHKHIRFSKFS